VSSNNASPACPAFTLIELLVVIAIIAILASVSFPAIASAMTSASKAKSAGNLKNFGVAMHSFVADNNGRLPGANGGSSGTLSGISPIAKSSSANSLQVQLMTYLEKERPSGNSWGSFFMKSLAYPAWEKFNKGTADNGVPSYIACQSYKLPDGSSISPFGGPEGTNIPFTLLQMQTRLTQMPLGQSKPYAVIETDQALYQRVTWNNPGWKSKLPSTPLHREVRNVLYFDGSVQAVSATNSPYCW